MRFEDASLMLKGGAETAPAEIEPHPLRANFEIHGYLYDRCGPIKSLIVLRSPALAPTTRPRRPGVGYSESGHVRKPHCLGGGDMRRRPPLAGKTYRSFRSYSGGGGAIGWHNNTLKIGVVFGCDQHPHFVRPRIACDGASSYSQRESHGTINPAGKLSQTSLARRSSRRVVHATFAREHEYKRHRTVSLLAGIDLVTSEVHALRLTYQPDPFYHRGVYKTAHSARQVGRKLDLGIQASGNVGLSRSSAMSRPCLSLAVAALAASLTCGVAVSQSTAPAPNPALETQASSEPSIAAKAENWTTKQWNAAKQKWSQDKAKWNACNQDTKDRRLSGRKSWSHLYDCMTKA